MRPIVRTLLLLLALSACAAGAARAHDPTPVMPQVVGGEDVPAPNPYPYQVFVGIGGSGPFSGSACGGSLIGPRWVLTAAHCVEGEPASRVRVVAGVASLSATTLANVYPASQVVVHPGFDPTGRELRGEQNVYVDDIALIELADSAAGNVGYIVQLAPGQDEALAAPGALATLTGWGGLRGYPPGGSPAGGQDYPDVLQAVDLPILADEACGAAYPFDGARQLCAGYVEGGKDACQGDSGGPLAVPDGQGGLRQAGVVSIGAGCAAQGYPGVYTRVSAYFDWIQAQVGPLDFPERLYLPALAQ